jgi:hypothetical protein
LATDFREEFNDILLCLKDFRLKKSDIPAPGGGGHRFQKPSTGSSGSANGQKSASTSKSLKNRVGIEVEWNNKTEFYDRDLNNFRLLWEMRVLSVGVIITRLSELQELFDELGKGESYGNSTTHWDKLIPKVESGGAGGCPLLIVGMGMAGYDAKN